MGPLLSLLFCALLTGVGCYHMNPTTKCVDIYIWYADGDVDCQYLITPSNWGIHTRARYFCREYSQTSCCATCAYLESIDYNVPGATTPPTTQPTTTPSPTTTLSPVTTVPNTCVDIYIWYADGSVDCQYLITPSNWNIHTRARYFCREYPQTSCCATCAYLESIDYNVPGATTPPTTQPPTPSPTTTPPPVTTVPNTCEDEYIWYADGSVDCQYLITRSSWGIHRRQRYFCTEYPQTSCCETCAFLARHDYDYDASNGDK